ncbi:MAG TPA: hypothetical protein VHV51_09590 [Polyangiaceae bacterium]|jgi:hypothetical protein|nr:hypothetical protein [Polyangiaceae bacterium]
MKRAALVLVLGFVAPACSLFSAPRPAANPAQEASALPPSASEVAPVASAEQAEVAPADPRQVGDYVVHRFSGSYEKSPLTLTEEIVAHEDGLWVIDYTFEQPSSTTKLRVRLDPKSDLVVRVSKLDANGKETKAPLSLYEKLMDRTSFSADSNDGQLATEHGTCAVGPSEFDCETKSYKVKVGDQDATLSVAHSDSVPGDVSGDITASDGTLIYRSELVEMGSAGSPRRGVASR